MIAEVHPEDSRLVQLTISECQQWIPDIPMVSVLRIYTSGHDARNGDIVEHWNRKFLINRLAADGAFDGSSITPDERYRIMTRTAAGQRLFIQSQVFDIEGPVNEAP